MEVKLFTGHRNIKYAQEHRGSKRATVEALNKKIDTGQSLTQVYKSEFNGLKALWNRIFPPKIKSYSRFKTW